MKNRARALENIVIKPLKAAGKTHLRVLLAVSGGVDSMVMAEVLWRWQRYLGWTIAVAHVHHGAAASSKQKTFRIQARRFVREYCHTRGIQFLTNTANGRRLANEAELRDYRLEQLERWRREGKFDFVALAHHRDDLLETRLLRLIRGTGSQGLKSMARRRGRVLRPLLTLSRQEVREYAELRALTWVEDPSNASLQPLRNWLRQSWLPALEQKQKGATKALARSLELAATKSFTAEVGEYVGLRREAMKGISSQEQRAAVARYFKSLGLHAYGSAHVDELLKRLATARKNLEFEMLGMKFHVSADLLWASRV